MECTGAEQPPVTLCCAWTKTQWWHDLTKTWFGKKWWEKNFKKYFVMKWGRFLYQPIDLSGACLSPNIVITTQAPFLEVFCGSTHRHIIFSSCHLPSEQFWSKQQQKQQDWCFINHPEVVLRFLEQLFSPDFLNILVSTFNKYLNALQSCCAEIMRLPACQTSSEGLLWAQKKQALRNSNTHPASLHSRWFHVSNLNLHLHFSKTLRNTLM